MLNYYYKILNSDFRVNEIINLILDGGEYYYYLLRKNGYRTMDVLDMISAEKFIDICNISYAGLKDEDAITTQYIAIKGLKIDNFEKTNGIQDVSLKYIGSANVPMQIGKLQGNSFRIRLRNLNLCIAELICEKEKHGFPIINYFGTQRFGMPNSVKISHKIGECLLTKNYVMALKYLYRSGNIDKFIYKKWENAPEKYLSLMDERRKTFFLSAYDAYIWNRNIIRLIEESDVEKIQFNKEGVKFIYVSRINDMLREALNESYIIWHRYNENGEVFENRSFRQPYLEVVYRSSSIQPDDIYPGKNMIDIEFILPAGVYATNVIDQIMTILEMNVNS